MDLNTIEALNFALPGLVMAWIYYGLTAHPKENNLERVVQALVFTAIVFFSVGVVEFVCLAAGRFAGTVGTWNSDVERIWAFVCAALLGILFALASNADGFHSFLRKLGITKNSGFPSVWFQSLYCRVTYVTLHLDDERRLMGWINMWPSKCEDGHFEIIEPTWLDTDDDGKLVRIELPNVQAIMISSKIVNWIEYLSEHGEKDPIDGQTTQRPTSTGVEGKK